MNEDQIPSKTGWYWALVSIDSAQCRCQWVIVSISRGGRLLHDGSIEGCPLVNFGANWLNPSKLIALGEYVAPLRYREDT